MIKRTKQGSFFKKLVSSLSFSITFSLVGITIIDYIKPLSPLSLNILLAIFFVAFMALYFFLSKKTKIFSSKIFSLPQLILTPTLAVLGAVLARLGYKMFGYCILAMAVTSYFAPQYFTAHAIYVFVECLVRGLHRLLESILITFYGHKPKRLKT